MNGEHLYFLPKGPGKHYLSSVPLAIDSASGSNKGSPSSLLTKLHELRSSASPSYSPKSSPCIAPCADFVVQKAVVLFIAASGSSSLALVQRETNGPIHYLYFQPRPASLLGLAPCRCVLCLDSCARAASQLYRGVHQHPPSSCQRYGAMCVD